MSAVPTVARWWGSRSDPQRLDLYTRWSFYGFLAVTPLLAPLGLGSGTGSPVALALYVAASAAVAATGVLAVRRGMAADTGRVLSGRLVALVFGTALVTAAAGVLAFRDEVDPTAVSWSVALPLGTALVVCSPVWPSLLLVRGGAVVGGLVGIAQLVSGAPPDQAVLSAVTFGTTVVAIAVAFRFSVWVLDVVREMERNRGVQLQLAVAEERLRFSRDLHDVMGRNLSAIAVKSQLAGELVRRGRPEAADEVADVARLAEESLREVRDVVRAHRSTDLAGELAGARSVLRAAGVDCTVDGEDAGATLPGTAQAALGWVVREAVTNVLRHSRATACTITLQVTGGGAELRVVNDGVSAEVAGDDGRPGSGLAGLGERLSGAGGRLEAGRDGSRFVLTAGLPGGADR
jgi:two-component system sensor histidine kinase DesK